MNEKYTYETDDHRDMELVVNKNRMLCTLYELKEWRRELNRGRAGDVKYLCEGKIYTNRELHEDNTLERDERGILKDCKEVYLVDDVIERIDGIVGDLWDLIDRNYC